MGNAMKVGVGVASGYLLGRRHKLRYAIGVGAWLVGRRVPLSPRALLRQGMEAARSDPDVMDLVDELRDTGWHVGRRAARTLLEDRAGRLTDRLRDGGDGGDGQRGGQERAGGERGGRDRDRDERGGDERGERGGDERDGGERESRDRAGRRRPAASRA